MIELMLAYLKQFRDGQISYKEFSQTMDLMLHLVDDINTALDSSCLLSVTDDGANARQWVGYFIEEYEQSPELVGLAVATCDQGETTMELADVKAGHFYGYRPSKWATNCTCVFAHKIGKQKVKVNDLDGKTEWVLPSKLTDFPAFTALVLESLEVGWPETYHNDLDVHDWTYLTSLDRPTQFGWGLRAWGTHIYDPRNQRDALALLDATEDTWGNGRTRYYWWDGVHLKGVSKKQLRECIKEYEEAKESA